MFNSPTKWLRYNNCVFVAKPGIDKFFIRKYPYKNITLLSQTYEKEVSKKELIYLLKLLIRKEKIFKIKENNML